MKSEITVAHVHLETKLVISDQFVQLLIVENPAEFYKMVSDLDGQFEGKEGDFAFSCAEQLISPFKYGAMVSDLFHFDLNDKKIVNLLYKRLESVAFGEKLSAFNELTAKSVFFLEELAEEVSFALDYDEMQPIDFLKAAGLKFEKNYESLEEKIICYINALIELKKCEFFVFVNLKSVLNDEKLLQVYKHCRLEQVGLLLIENASRRPVLPCEKAVIITDDLCEILANYDDL